MRACGSHNKDSVRNSRGPFPQPCPLYIISDVRGSILVFSTPAKNRVSSSNYVQSLRIICALPPRDKSVSSLPVIHKTNATRSRIRQPSLNVRIVPTNFDRTFRSLVSAKFISQISVKLGCRKYRKDNGGSGQQL